MRPTATAIAAFALATTALALPYGARDHTLMMRDVIAPDHLLGRASVGAEPVARDDAGGTLSMRTVTLKPGILCARGWKRCCGLCPTVSPALLSSLFPTKKTRSAASIEDLD